MSSTSSPSTRSAGRSDSAGPTRLRLRVDERLCCGHGRCYALCPELFEEDDAGHAVLVTHEVPAALADRARAAADNCPESAITVEG